MNYCIVYAHPNPKSFNHAIKERVLEEIKSKGGTYTLIDLYEDKFNPVLAADDFIALSEGKVLPDVEKYQGIIAKSEHLIFIYPIWWFGLPAILKGWIDRVFSHGFAYRDDEAGFTPLLSSKSATLIVTLGSPEESLIEADMDKFMQCMTVGTMGLVGINPVKVVPLYSVPTISQDERKKLLGQIKL